MRFGQWGGENTGPRQKTRHGALLTQHVSRQGTPVRWLTAATLGIEDQYCRFTDEEAPEGPKSELKQ
jgi:hypothetical protein